MVRYGKSSEKPSSDFVYDCQPAASQLERNASYLTSNPDILNQKLGVAYNSPSCNKLDFDACSSMRIIDLNIYQCN